MNPNDLIDKIVALINQAEISHDPYGLIEARRLLSNDLRQAIADATLVRVPGKYFDAILPARDQ